MSIIYVTERTTTSGFLFSMFFGCKTSNNISLFSSWQFIWVSAERNMHFIICKIAYGCNKNSYHPSRRQFLWIHHKVYNTERPCSWFSLLKLPAGNKVGQKNSGRRNAPEVCLILFHAFLISVYEDSCSTKKRDHRSIDAHIIPS